MEKLIRSVIDCPNIRKCLNNNEALNHPCSKIVNSQQAKSFDEYQLPEPFNGNIEEAPILFISSNPSIDRFEEYPMIKWSIEEINDFFINRFKNKWVKNQLYTLNITGEYNKKWVRFWAGIRKRTSELLDKKDIQLGRDCAFLEVVRCKSIGESGVIEAMDECVKLHFQNAIGHSNAKVIIGMGKCAEQILCKLYNITFDTENIGKIHKININDIERYLVFMPHTNSRRERTFESILTQIDLITLRKFLS